MLCITILVFLLNEITEWVFSGMPCFLGHKSKTIGDKRRMCPWVAIVRFVGKYPLVHFRASHREVGLEDVRSENLILDAIGRGGVAIAFRESEIAATLFGRSGNVDFLYGNGEWGSEP